MPAAGRSGISSAALTGQPIDGDSDADARAPEL